MDLNKQDKRTIINNVSYAFSTFVGILVLIVLFGCDKTHKDPYEIDDNNDNDTIITIEDEIGPLLRDVQLNFYVLNPVWIMQLQQNFIGDMYSGYMMSPTPFNDNVNNMTYSLDDGWNGFPWSVADNNVMNRLAMMDDKIDGNTEYNDYIALGKIFRVEAMHRVSDIYGPIVYSKFGIPSDDGSVPYDCQEDAYNQFFNDLQEGIEILTPYANSAEINNSFKKYDLVYGGNYSSWIKFANSLRLRLAIRISNINPVKAKQEAEAALANAYGLLQSNEKNFMIDAKLPHPLNTINNDWNDVRMGASMESILGGFQDPREAIYFQTSLIEDGVFKGIRLGIDIKAKSDYQPFSKLGDLGLVQLMTCSEVAFLKAEGDLRGWNMGGTAQGFYEEGIRLSFEQHGLDPSEYIANNVFTPMVYVDPIDDINNIDAASALTIKWNDADDNELKLEKIITQKWIAMFPDGQEAWSEFRRTGYPKLFPVMENNSGGTISTEDFIKRINFVANEYTINPIGVSNAIECLGGPDNGGTNLWWDLDGGNF